MFFLLAYMCIIYVPVQFPGAGLIDMLVSQHEALRIETGSFPRATSSLIC